jgi:hypothetical protein
MNPERSLAEHCGATAIHLLLSQQRSLRSAQRRLVTESPAQPAAQSLERSATDHCGATAIHLLLSQQRSLLSAQRLTTAARLRCVRRCGRRWAPARSCGAATSSPTASSWRASGAASTRMSREAGASRSSSAAQRLGCLHALQEGSASGAASTRPGSAVRRGPQAEAAQRLGCVTVPLCRGAHCVNPDRRRAVNK